MLVWPLVAFLRWSLSSRAASGNSYFYNAVLKVRIGEKCDDLDGLLHFLAQVIVFLVAASDTTYCHLPKPNSSSLSHFLLTFNHMSSFEGSSNPPTQLLTRR